MAAAGKKSKKTKWIKTNITEIIAEPTAIATTNNWADSVDDEVKSFGYASSHRNRAPVVLPSASRAARGGMAVDDDAIPKRPPFIAHISNLPYDVDETAITELFDGLKIGSLRLPREGDRLKGYGYVDFEDRESLIDAMNMPDLTIGGRRIRIEVSTHDNDRRGMSRTGRNDRERDYDPERTMGDWRSGPRAVPDPQPRREGARDGARERDPPRERDREESAADNRPGGWRDGDRPAAEPARTPYGGRDSFGRDRFGEDRRERGFGGGRDSDRGERSERSGYGGRDGFRTAERDGGGGFGNRDSRGFGSRGFGDRDRDRDPPSREEQKPRERPKLNLLPRTVPRETEAPSKPADGALLDEKQPEKAPLKPVSAESVFGAAKPVDTSAKEREIEERLRKQEEEARRVTEEKERWTRKTDDSGERRTGARRDDRGKDTRSYNTDKRDYSKDDRERRDYSRDDRDRRDYSKDDRNRRDADTRDRRDYSRDNRDRRDYTNDDRDQRDSDKDRSDYSKDNRERENSKDRNKTPERKDDGVEKDERNGRSRPSRSRDRYEDDERPLPKFKEQDKPNFVASNKFSFLENVDDGGTD